MIVVYKAEIPRREVESGTELARQWRDANLIRAVDTTPAELGQSWRHIIENPGSNPELQDISNPGGAAVCSTIVRICIELFLRQTHLVLLAQIAGKPAVLPAALQVGVLRIRLHPRERFL